MSFDADSSSMKMEIQSDSFWEAGISGFLRLPGTSFDENSKFYLCSDRDGTSPNACTVSELMFEYRFYREGLWTQGHVGGVNRIICVNLSS